MVTLDQAGFHRATVAILPAPAPLRDVVDFLWIDERPRFAVQHRHWRVVPDDAPHLIYYRYVDGHAGSERHRLNVVGARARYADVDCTGRLFTVGVRLRPGAVPALFRVAAHEVTDRSVPAALIASRPVRALLSRLDGDAPADVARHLTSFITGLVAEGRPVDERAAWLATHASTRRSVHQLAGTLGVGDRALRNWSATHLGLGLKRFLSVRRLHAALRTRLERPTATWSQIAAATGFADQPHLVRECRAMLGESPGTFFGRAS